MWRSWPRSSTCEDAIHIGHSTGGGEVARYVARHGTGPGRQGRADRRRAADHAEDGQQSRRPADRGVRRLPRALAANRAAVLSGYSDRPVLRLQPPGRARSSRASSHNWWRQGMMGGAKAHYDCIKAFSETDFTEDLKKIDVPALVMHGDDDQIVPDRRLGAALGQAPEERHAEGLQGLSARHVHDPCGRHQPGPAGVREKAERTHSLRRSSPRPAYARFELRRVRVRRSAWREGGKRGPRSYKGRLRIPACAGMSGGESQQSGKRTSPSEMTGGLPRLSAAPARPSDRASSSLSAPSWPAPGVVPGHRRNRHRRRSAATGSIGGSGKLRSSSMSVNTTLPDPSCTGTRRILVTMVLGCTPSCTTA